MRFYDISGDNAANPQLLYQNNRDTHEFYIWEDPKNPKRALMFAASAGSSFQIYDISPLLNADPATRGRRSQLFNGAHGFGNCNGSGHPLVLGLQRRQAALPRAAHARLRRRRRVGVHRHRPGDEHVPR